MPNIKFLDNYEEIDNYDNRVKEEDESKNFPAAVFTSPNSKDFYFSFNPAKPVPGNYDINFSQTNGQYFSKKEIGDEELIDLNDEIANRIIEDVKQFWNSKPKYKNFNIPYKRGLLIYGPPGVGKTAVVKKMMKTIINDYEGLVFNMPPIDDFINFMYLFRSVEPERQLLVVIEEIDSYIEKNPLDLLLTVLDGTQVYENIVFVATTNIPENLDDRITNRPSRFDKRYKIEIPSKEARKNFIQTKLKEKDIQIDVDRWVKDTEKFSIAHLKELFISVIVMGNKYEDSLKTLKDMIGHKIESSYQLKRGVDSKIGFGG